MIFFKKKYLEAKKSFSERCSSLSEECNNSLGHTFVPDIFRVLGVGMGIVQTPDPYPT